jgi:hypothetical protein
MPQRFESASAEILRYTKAFIYFLFILFCVSSRVAWPNFDRTWFSGPDKQAI